MKEKTKITRGSLFFALCAAVLMMFCALAGACVELPEESGSSSSDKTIVAPDITGPSGQTVLEGYSSFSSEKFTVSGDNVNVSANVPTAAADKIVWNAESLCISVSEGLLAGEYKVTLKATNGDETMDKTIVYTLTVEACEPPMITSENDKLYLVEGYEAVVSDEFTVTGTSVRVSATCSNKDAEDKITWNDATKRLEVAAGLPVGNYTVVLTASNGTPAMDAILEYKIFVTAVPKVMGETKITLDGADYTESVFNYSTQGRNVTVAKRSGDELIVWDAENLTLTVKAGLEIGEHKVELVASNGDKTFDNVLEITVTVNRLYTMTGSYEYGSGKYDGTSGKYINDGDSVTVQIGEMTAMVDASNQTYTLERVPEGEYVIIVESDYYLPVEIKVDISGENEDFAVQENIVLKNPKMATTNGVTYDENGSVTVENETAALFAGNSVTAAGEGFVVKYTVPSNNNGKQWFNRGGLHVETNATERNKYDFGFVKYDANWAIYVKQSDVKDRENSAGFAAFDVTDEWIVTAIYSDGIYYFAYESADGTKKYANAFMAQSFTYVKGSEITDTAVTRMLGLSSYTDKDFSTTFKDVSYAIGNEAAKNALKSMPNPEMKLKVAGGTKITLPNAEAKNGEGFVICYTIGKKSDGNAWFVRGGLAIASSDNGTSIGYNFGFAPGNGEKSLYIRKNGGTANYLALKAVKDDKWIITVAFYNGEYFFKFDNGGETVGTFKLTSAHDFTQSMKDHKDILFSTTASRTLELHAFNDNKVDTTFSKINYSIGNQAAQEAIAAMGFAN